MREGNTVDIYQQSADLSASVSNSAATSCGGTPLEVSPMVSLSPDLPTSPGNSGAPGVFVEGRYGGSEGLPSEVDDLTRRLPKFCMNTMMSPVRLTHRACSDTVTSPTNSLDGIPSPLRVSSRSSASSYRHSFGSIEDVGVSERRNSLPLTGASPLLGTALNMDAPRAASLRRQRSFESVERRQRSSESVEAAFRFFNTKGANEREDEVENVVTTIPEGSILMDQAGRAYRKSNAVPNDGKEGRYAFKIKVKKGVEFPEAFGEELVLQNQENNVFFSGFTSGLYMGKAKMTRTVIISRIKDLRSLEIFRPSSLSIITESAGVSEESPHTERCGEEEDSLPCSMTKLAIIGPVGSGLHKRTDSWDSFAAFSEVSDGVASVGDDC